MKLYLLTALGCLLSIVSHAEWNRFRGPNGSGVSDSAALPSAVDDTVTLWKAQLGKGWSSPVIWKEQVFVTAETGGGKRALLCLSLKDGAEIWRHEQEFKEHRQHQFNSFASSTPYVDAAAVYVTWSSGDALQALALSHSGKVLWSRPHVADYIHEHGTGSSPVVADGVLLVRSEFDVEKNGKSLVSSPEQMQWKSSILGLDASSGKTLWTLPVANTLNPYSTPVIRTTSAGQEFILSNTTSGVMGLDTRTGKMNWQYNPGYEQRSLGSYAFSGDQLFCTFGSGGGGKEIAVIKLKGNSVQPIDFPVKKGLPYVPTPLVYGDYLYLLGDGGILRCVEWQSGKEIYDERVDGSKGSTKFFSSPVAGDGKIYCASQTGDFVIIQAGPSFKQLSTSLLDSPINATPALTDKRLLVRTEKMLWCVGNKTALP